VDYNEQIWKFHKRVCGKNPFEWPPLTEEEAEEAWNIRNWPYSPLFGETWLERLMGAMRQAKPEALGGTEGEEGLGWMEIHFKVRSGIASSALFLQELTYSSLPRNC